MGDLIKKIKFGSLDFLNIILFEREISPFYIKITNTLSQEIIFSKSALKINGLKNKIYVIKDVPNYLNPQIDPLNKVLKINKVNTYEGFMINLRNYENIDQYLEANFSANRRSKFRTYQKRLELCFNIQYKMFYGNISESEYNYLFDELRIMLKKRFQQKKAINEDLKLWDYYQEQAYQMIFNKKACLFVVYNGKKPISICLNLVYGKIFFGFIKSFDADYSKFYIGFIDWIKQLEWCFTNGFEIFDMLKGDLEYKRGFADEIYQYQNHIVYDSSSIRISLLANYKSFKTAKYYQLLHFFKARNLHLLYRKFKSYRYNKLKLADEIENEQEICIDYNINIPSNENLIEININDEKYAFLRKTVYDFLYSQSEHISNIAVFQIERERSYFLKGKKRNLKFSFINSLVFI